jgi:hypothetical protein
MTTIKTEAMLQHLLLQGAVEISGFDTVTGETIYSITDKLQSVSPKMYEDLDKTFRENMYKMIDQGPKIMQWRIKID